MHAEKQWAYFQVIKLVNLTTREQEVAQFSEDAINLAEKSAKWILSLEDTF